MISQSALDAADYLVASLSHAFEGSIDRTVYGEEQVGEGQAFRTRVIIYLNPDFHETRGMYDIGYGIIDFIYRQHGVMVHFMLKQEDADDERDIPHEGT